MCVHMCSFVSIYCSIVWDVCVCVIALCVRAFALREQLHSKAFLAVAVEVAKQKWWVRIDKMSCQIMKKNGGGKGLP